MPTVFDTDHEFDNDTRVQVLSEYGTRISVLSQHGTRVSVVDDPDLEVTDPAETRKFNIRPHDGEERQY